MSSYDRLTNFTAGMSGGILSTLCLHPLDLAKVRMQVNEGTNTVPERPNATGVFQTLKHIFKYRGISGLYLGLVPNMIGSGSSWGLYFVFYGYLKSLAQSGDSSKQLSNPVYFTCASAAGLATISLTNPVFVVKTQLILQYEQQRQSSSSTSDGQTTTRPGGFASTLRQLWLREGLVGFYRGFVPAQLAIFHGALQFTAYEFLRNRCNTVYHKGPIDAKLSPLEYVAFASISKIIAASVFYPTQVVRSRLQDQHRSYNGVLHVIQETWIYEGLPGFYKGLVPCLLRVTPACAITFLTYECVVNWSKRFKVPDRSNFSS